MGSKIMGFGHQISTYDTLKYFQQKMKTKLKRINKLSLKCEDLRPNINMNTRTRFKNDLFLENMNFRIVTKYKNNVTFKLS